MEVFQSEVTPPHTSDKSVHCYRFSGEQGGVANLSKSSIFFPLAISPQGTHLKKIRIYTYTHMYVYANVHERFNNTLFIKAVY